MSNLIPHDDEQPGWGRRPPPPPRPEPMAMRDDAVDLRQVIGVLRRNAAMVSAVALVVFAAAAFLALRQEPLYSATATVRLKDERSAITSGIEGAAMEQVMGKQNDPLLSQLQVLRSRAVAEEVVNRMGLRLQPVDTEELGLALRDVRVAPELLPETLSVHFEAERYSVRRGSETYVAAYGEQLELGALSFAVAVRPRAESASLALLTPDEAIEQVRENLRARQMERTDVVEVEYTARDPHIAQAVANTAVEVFQSVNARSAQQQSRRRRIFLEEQLQQTNVQLAEAQSALSDFRRRETVFSSRDRFSAQQTGLIGVEVRREEMDADRRMYQSLLNALVRPSSDRARGLEALVSSPGIAANPVVAQLYTQLTEYQTQRDGMTTGQWASAQTHPDVQRLNGLIASTEVKLVDAVRSHVAALDARIAALDDLRSRSAAELQALPESEAEEVRLVQQLETISRMSDLLREEYQKSRLSEAVEVGQVEIVDLASLPQEPVGSGRGLKLGLGLLLGLLLGSGGAFVREHLNTSIRSREDVEQVLGIPGLGVIPKIGQGLAGPSRLRLPGMKIAGSGSTALRTVGNRDELVMVIDARSNGAEAFRMLRTNLIFSQSVQKLKSVVVTSATPGEGKTTTATNLAVSFAQQGMRVLLVDCDLRRSRVHKVFDVKMQPGVTELAMGIAAPADAIRTTHVDGLMILPSGNLPPNPAELLGSARMKALLEKLSAGFDLVILDTPPMVAATDASVLGAAADGVVLVVRAGRTDRNLGQHAVQQLASVGARVVGAVLNDPDAEVPRYSGYYQYYYKSYYATEEV